MSSRIIVYAPGVHQGGGAILLNHLLSSLAFCQSNVLLMLDPRFQLNSSNIPSHINVQLLRVGIIGRLKNEFTLWQIVTQHDHVLCFSNLPPFFKLKATVSVYCQNRGILEPDKLKYLSAYFFLRFWLQNWLMHCFKKHANEYIVQTPSMRRLLLPIVAKLGITIRIQPFWNQTIEYPRSVEKSRSTSTYLYDFIYPAAAVPHKNHRNLVEAWILLANDNYYPTLCLTINHHTPLWQWIHKQVIDYRLRIINLGQISNAHLNDVYDQCGCLIYPSILESLGLPLLEVRFKNMAIVAAELDYVRDVVDPEQTFDPKSPISIARAVQRWNEQSIQSLPIVSAEKCLASIEYLQKYSSNFITH